MECRGTCLRSTASAPISIPKSIVRAMFRAIVLLTSVFHVQPITFQHPHSTEKRRPTWGQIVFKAHANLTLRVGDDREACLSVNVLIGEVDVSLGYGTDDADVGALAGDRTDVSGDDDEWVWVGCVPYALFRLDFSWREGEFDSGGRGGR